MIGKKFYVFTNWGLVKGTVIKERVDNDHGVPQYKLDIDIDKDNLSKGYGFWFCKDQLHKTVFGALFNEIKKYIKRY